MSLKSVFLTSIPKSALIKSVLKSVLIKKVPRYKSVLKKSVPNLILESCTTPLQDCEASLNVEDSHEMLNCAESG